MHRMRMIAIAKGTVKPEDQENDKPTGIATAPGEIKCTPGRPPRMSTH